LQLRSAQASRMPTRWTIYAAAGSSIALAIAIIAMLWFI
jgi:hypothetical protein